MVVGPASATENTATAPCRQTLRQRSKPRPCATSNAARCTNSVASGNHASGPLWRSRSPWIESCATLTSAGRRRVRGCCSRDPRQRQPRARVRTPLGRRGAAEGELDGALVGGAAGGVDAEAGCAALTLAALTLRTTPVRGSSLRWLVASGEVGFITFM